MITIFRKIRQKMIAENRVSRYMLYAIGEIILVVIGILIALQVNNWNEERKEQKRLKQYAKSLVEDLKSDISMLNVSLQQAQMKHKVIDSLRIIMYNTPVQELSNLDLYIIMHDIIYRPYKWNRSTLNELKNSGGLGYITNENIQKKLVAYESFSYHLDEDFEFDKTNSQKAEDAMASILDLNSPYLYALSKMDDDVETEDLNEYFEMEEYRKAKENDLPLLTYDEQEIKKMMNIYILIQDNYEIRAFNEMPEIISNAHELIGLLQNEYLNPD